MQASAQAEIEDFNGIFQERLRGIVREGLLAMFEQEVTSLCGEMYHATVFNFGVRNRLQLSLGAA